MKKSGIKAFFLGFIPGMGHIYLRKFNRGFLYPVIAVMIVMIFFVIGLAAQEEEIAIFGGILGLIVWVISGIDLFITIISRPDQRSLADPPSGDSEVQRGAERDELESNKGSATSTIALSFIPGLGHLHMGLMMRGLSFLISFFGILTMIVFVSAFTNEDGFLVFLGVLPILWVYNLFDTMQLYHRRNRGETIEDRTIFEELTQHRDHGKKSKIIAMFLSLMPGAGHMYLGLQRRGLQLMIAFLLSIYILDVLRLSLFLFLIPVLWFFSFFDALQQLGRYEQGGAVDAPIVDWLINHQRWVGYGLLALGAFYIVDSVLVPVLYEYFPRFRIRFIYEQYVQTTIVSLVLILGGLKLLSGSRRRRSSEEQLQHSDNGGDDQ